MEGPPPLNNVTRNLQSDVDNASTQDTRGNKDSIFLHIQMNTSYIPRIVKSVFEENIQLLPRVQTNQVRQFCDAVRKFIYPHIKFLNYKYKETEERAFDRFDNHQGDMKVLSRSNVHAYLLINSMQLNHLDTIDQAVYWNTYIKLVDTTLSVNSSSDISVINNFLW